MRGVNPRELALLARTLCAGLSLFCLHVNFVTLFLACLSYAQLFRS